MKTAFLRGGCWTQLTLVLFVAGGCDAVPQKAGSDKMEALATPEGSVQAGSTGGGKEDVKLDSLEGRWTPKVWLNGRRMLVSDCSADKEHLVLREYGADAGAGPASEFGEGYVYRLNSQATPKEIDVVCYPPSKGFGYKVSNELDWKASLKGIYEMTGDTVTIVLTGDSRMPRPKAIPKKPEPGYWTIRLDRERKRGHHWSSGDSIHNF